MKRLIILLCILSLLLVGCETTEAPAPLTPGISAAEKEEAPKGTLTSPGVYFFPDADTNPITTTNLANHLLLRSVYQPLVTTDKNLSPVNRLVTSAEHKDTTITFNLHSDAKFSDGSFLTAADVVYSFELAMQTKTSPYYKQLQNVEKVSAKGKNTVVISLKQPDADALCAMDVPIIGEKNGLGCGPYCLDQKEGEAVLVANPHALQTPSISVLMLKEAQSSESMIRLFSGGIADILPGALLTEQTTGFTRDYQTDSFLTDQMVYIGTNQAEGKPLAKQKLREAIHYALDRTQLSKSVLVSMAQPTMYPYPADWYRAKQNETECVANLKAALAAMGELSYTRPTTLWQDADGNALTLQLLVNRDVTQLVAVAKNIATQLSGFGITVEVIEKTTEAYNAAKENGAFDFFVDVYRIGREVDASPLFTPGSDKTYGALTDPIAANAFAAYKKDGNLSTFQKTFAEALPILPLAFLKQPLYTTTGLSVDPSAGLFDPYGNWTAWKLS